MSATYNHLIKIGKEDLREFSDDELIKHYTDVVSMISAYFVEYKNLIDKLKKYSQPLEKFDHLNNDDKMNKMVEISNLDGTNSQMTLSECKKNCDEITLITEKHAEKFEKLNQIKNLILMDYKARGFDDF